MRPGEAEAALSAKSRTVLEDRAFAESVIEASADCIKFIGLDGALLFMNSLGLRLMQIDDFATYHGKPYAAMWPAHNRAIVERALEAARGGEVARFCADCLTAKGEQRWWDVVMSPVRDADGRIKGLAAISRDVTERRREEEAAALMAQEAAHRTKNFFAVVEGLISLSARRASQEAQTFAETLRARLAALGRAVNYVGPLEPAPHLSLHGLARELFAPYDSIALSGDDAQVGRNGSAALALALHELSTNAVKYGALARPGGRAKVETRRRGDRYEIVWEESGARLGKPGAPGFGSTLIDNAVRTHLEGAIERTWRAEGLRVRMDVALGALAR